MSDTPNVFDKNRMSSEAIMSGWLSCKEKQTLVTNEVIASHYCSCLFDWVRTLHLKDGESSLLNISKNIKLKMIGNDCHILASNQQPNSFGKGIPESKYEKFVMGTSAIIVSQMGCVNVKSSKSTKYKIKMCSCITDHTRRIYRKYGREEFIDSMIESYSKGKPPKKIQEKTKFCDNYARNQ